MRKEMKYFSLKKKKKFDNIFFKINFLKTATSRRLAKDVTLKFGLLSCVTKKIAMRFHAEFE